jgi:hypothetical protein
MTARSMPDVTAIFGQPFAQQLAAWRLRLGELRPTWSWTDVEPQFHDRGFMVAGATKADLLADLAAAVDKAISRGTSLEEFRRDFRATVEKRGWHGWAGEGTKKGEAWRTRTIYKTNMATTYAAGRRAQLIEGGFAFWVYRHGGSREPRILHLGWNGLALPPDHPFWASPSPPKGWGCSCYVTGARTHAGIIRAGGDPDKTLPDGWQSLDPRTGEPSGIDKGWGYAPGASVSETVTALVPRLDTLPERPSIDLIQNWLRLDAFADWMRHPQGTWPLARIPQQHADELGAKVKVAMLSAETAAKQEREHPELKGIDYLMAQRTIDAATRRIQDTPLSMIYVLEEKTVGYVLVVKVTQTGQGLFVQSFRRLSSDAARRDRTIRRLLRKGDV